MGQDEESTWDRPDAANLSDRAMCKGDVARWCQIPGARGRSQLQDGSREYEMESEVEVDASKGGHSWRRS